MTESERDPSRPGAGPFQIVFLNLRLYDVLGSGQLLYLEDINVLWQIV